MTDPRILVGDCRKRMAELPAGSIHAVVCDPPYGLEFMGKDWDAPWRQDTRQPGDATFHVPAGSPWANGVRHGMAGSYGPNGNAALRAFQAWCEEWATEALRVLAPGGHLLAFGGTRTWHRLACGVEDAGFEVRDSIAWLYGSGFPKSLNVARAIDKAGGADGLWVQEDHPGRPGARPRAGAIIGQVNHASDDNPDGLRHTYRPATDDARTFDGWGTALKPAFEPILVARKPLAGTVAGNVLAHGTGAINIDGCRIPHRGAADLAESVGKNQHSRYQRGSFSGDAYGDWEGRAAEDYDGAGGRWPANLVVQHGDRCVEWDDGTWACAEGCVVADLDEQAGPSSPGNRPGFRSGIGYGSTSLGTEGGGERLDGGGPSRFFYCPKAGADERPRGADGEGHATVKPLALMRWLIRLVTPPGGVVLDPFLGSGTTAEAAELEGVRWVGCEMGDGHDGRPDYLTLIGQRLARVADGTSPGLPQPKPPRPVTDPAQPSLFG